MRAQESFKIVNQPAGTYGPYFIQGGKYQLAITVTGTPSINLQQLGPDGATWLNVNASALVANGVTNYDLPPGQYQIVIGTSTANYVTLTRVPEE